MKKHAIADEFLLALKQALPPDDCEVRASWVMNGKAIRISVMYLSTQIRVVQYTSIAELEQIVDREIVIRHTVDAVNSLHDAMLDVREPGSLRAGRGRNQ